MNPDVLFSDGSTTKFDLERDFYNILGLEAGDLMVANVADIDLVEVQGRLILILIVRKF